MEIGFKEKTYEKAFSHEIARLTTTTFSPDQVDEAFLGFDDAFWLPWGQLLGVLPPRWQTRWSRLTGFSLRNLDRVGEELSHEMPPWRFNLFVQYKRPVYLTSRGAGEWQHWKSPYYRFQITPHQQDALTRLDDQSHRRAATVYARAICV